jgi:hypothetical protein
LPTPKPSVSDSAGPNRRVTADRLPNPPQHTRPVQFRDTDPYTQPALNIPETGILYQPSNPLSGRADSRVIRDCTMKAQQLLRRKENSPQGFHQRLWVLLRCHDNDPSLWFRNLDLIPFRPMMRPLYPGKSKETYGTVALFGARFHALRLPHDLVTPAEPVTARTRRPTTPATQRVPGNNPLSAPIPRAA